jgi:hypothetical protein
MLYAFLSGFHPGDPGTSTLAGFQDHPFLEWQTAIERYEPTQTFLIPDPRFQQA